MHRKTLSRSITCLWVVLLLSEMAFAQKAKPAQPEQPPLPPDRQLTVPPSGPSFYVGTVAGGPGMFSVLLGDGVRTVTGTFTTKQIEVFEAVLLAAKDFAQTDEAVGKTTPIITRLMDQHEWSLFVDVSKQGDRSKFYVTLATVTGRLTVPAGEIVRGSKKETEILFTSVLAKVQEARMGLTPQR
jgi:hypothetical protein